MDIISYNLADEALVKLTKIADDLKVVKDNLGTDVKKGYPTTSALLTYLLSQIGGTDELKQVLSNFEFVESESDLPPNDTSTTAKFFFVRQSRAIFVYDTAQSKWLGLIGSTLSTIQSDTRSALAKADQALINAVNAIATADNALNKSTANSRDIGVLKNTDTSLQSQINNLNGKVDTATSKANVAYSFALTVKGTADDAKLIAQQAKDAANSANVNLKAFTDQLEVAKAMALGAQDTAEDAAIKSGTALTKATTAESTANSIALTANRAETTAAEAKAIANNIDSKATRAESKADSAITKADQATSDVTQAKINAQSALTLAGQASTKADEAKANAVTASSVANNAKATADAIKQAWDSRAVPPEGQPIDYDTLNNKIMSVDVKAGEAKGIADNASSKADNAVSTANTVSSTVGLVDQRLQALEATVTDHITNHPTGTGGGGMTEAEKADIYDKINANKTLATNADTKAQSAINSISNVQTIANNAKTTADGIDAKATDALKKAGDAVTLANGLTSRIQSAEQAAINLVAIAEDAKTTAEEAKATADGIDAKATQAQADASTAKSVAEGVDAKATEALTKANDSLAAVDTANQAKDIAEAIDSKATRAMLDASDAKTIAEGVDSKAQTALDNATTAKSDASIAKTTAEGINAKAQTALDTANAAKTTADTAKTTADGINAKATQAQTDASSALTKANQAITDSSTAKTNAADALTKANAATTTANGIDGKATTALTNANAAITTANAAKATADGINAKVDTANANATSAKNTATNAMDTANRAATVADKADNKADQAILKADSALSKIADFKFRGYVGTKAELNVITDATDGDLIVVRESRRFYYYDATVTPNVWVDMGLGEELMATMRSIQNDIKLSASPYTTLKDRLDKLEGYLRQWEISRIEDFNGGTYEGTKYSTGIVLDKKMNTTVISDCGLPIPTDFLKVDMPAEYNIDKWYGKGGLLKSAYKSANTFKDFDMVLDFQFSGNDQIKVVGARMNAAMTQGYLFVFKKQAGVDPTSGLVQKNQIQVYYYSTTSFTELASIPFAFFDNTPYSFRIRLDGTAIQVYRGLAKVIDITHTSLTSGYVGGLMLTRRTDLIDQFYTDDYTNVKCGTDVSSGKSIVTLVNRMIV